MRSGENCGGRGGEGLGGLPERLSGTVKCNPKSTASSWTTILMEMGNILYQGYHILLEMTVSKVGVETMATKQLFASSPSRREGSPVRSQRVGEREECESNTGEARARRPVTHPPPPPNSFVPSLLVLPHFGI